MASVRAPNPPRNVADQAESRQPLSQAIEQARRDRVVTTYTGARVTPHPESSARTSRALTSYARVAESGESGNLRELLGFDAYA